MKDPIREQRDRIAQWAFDTRPILSRFHLWLDDVQVTWVRGEPAAEFTRQISFADGRMERLFAMTAAVTALGTKLFGRYGEGRGKDKAALNRVKKDADAISAYAMSEGLWAATRQLPENHAVMVCLGEGLMPKGGETPEMGSNPQLGFGRIYARPQVAQWLEQKVTRLLNDPSYTWDEFHRSIRHSLVTIWGAAIDTLENTSRFALGEPTGPMTVLHLYDQALRISKPYEGYMGNLLLPRAVVDTAAERAILIDFHTPRAFVLEAIRATYPDIEPAHVHVWTLRGKTRAPRIGGLWDQWRALGAHLIDDGDLLPSGLPAFTDSGTYAPTFRVGAWRDEAGRRHVFLVDGYAASAEAVQAATLAPMCNVAAFLSVFTSKFALPYDRERHVMRLDPAAPDFAARMAQLAGKALPEAELADYREMIRDGQKAGLALDRRAIVADDFFPEKQWEVLSLGGYMCPDPYTGAPGIEAVGEGAYRATTRLATPRGEKLVTFTLRLQETMDQSRLVFSPLLNRFFYGEDFRARAVKISDSGRIRNELQTLCLEALEFVGAKTIRLTLSRIPPEVISVEHQAVLQDVLHWYKTHHPIWFDWLEVAP